MSRCPPLNRLPYRPPMRCQTIQDVFVSQALEVGWTWQKWPSVWMMKIPMILALSQVEAMVEVIPHLRGRKAFWREVEALAVRFSTQRLRRRETQLGQSRPRSKAE